MQDEAAVVESPHTGMDDVPDHMHCAPALPMCKPDNQLLVDQSPSCGTPPVSCQGNAWARLLCQTRLYQSLFGHHSELLGHDRTRGGYA